jgi:hypothetical protein
MQPLPATDLRQNVATLGVRAEQLPALTRAMLRLLPPEDYDPDFQGQYLQTSYFDTPGFALRKARLKKDKYCTVRIRCYAPSQSPGRNYPEGRYALSAKTEDGKFRVELPDDQAEAALRGDFNAVEDYLPPDLLARLYDLTEGDLLSVATVICFTRYAVESTTDRLTLDCSIHAGLEKCFPFTGVLEVKTTARPYEPPQELLNLGLLPLRLSKFLWATNNGDR